MKKTDRREAKTSTGMPSAEHMDADHQELEEEGGEEQQAEVDTTPGPPGRNSP